MDAIFNQVIGLIVATLFGALCTYTLGIKKQWTGTKNALYSLVKSQINAEWRRLMVQGFVYIHDLEALQSLNCEYVQMGGNGAVKLLMKDIENLPRKVNKGQSGTSFPHDHLHD